MSIKIDLRNQVRQTKVDDYDDYQKRLSSFMEQYNELGASALAQYVAHRKIILEFLTRAISIPDGERKYPLERVVHQLVFPMRQTSKTLPIPNKTFG
jgi:hypothetical protein